MYIGTKGTHTYMYYMYTPVLKINMTEVELKALVTTIIL